MVLSSWLWYFTSGPSSSLPGRICQHPECDQLWLPELCLELSPDRRLNGLPQAWQVSLLCCLVQEGVAVTDPDVLLTRAVAIIGYTPSSLVPVERSTLERLVSYPLACFQYLPDRSRVPRTEGLPQQGEDFYPSVVGFGPLLVLLSFQL